MHVDGRPINQSPLDRSFFIPNCRNDQQQQHPFQPHRFPQRIVVAALTATGDQYSTCFSPPKYVRSMGS